VDNHRAPLTPAAKEGGNKRTVDVRAVVNGVMYLLSTRCQWAALPKGLPARRTVNDHLRRWDDATLGRIDHALYIRCRELAGREASPIASIIESQSVKSAEKKGPASIRTATGNKPNIVLIGSTPPSRFCTCGAHHCMAQPCRRLAKDWECLNRSGLMFLHRASIRLMLHKLCQKIK
jgi:transposase